jgi:hypothetical protein
MTVAPVPGHVPISTRPPDAHGRLVQSAVGLSAVFVVAVVAAIMTFAIGYAAGGQSAIEDNWVAVLGVTLSCVGLLASLAAFVLAVVAKIRGERWTLLWAPLWAFPAFVAFLVLGEAFWWE